MMNDSLPINALASLPEPKKAKVFVVLYKFLVHAVLQNHHSLTTEKVTTFLNAQSYVKQGTMAYHICEAILKEVVSQD